MWPVRTVRAVAGLLGQRGVAAYVRPSLFLGHRHAHQRAGLFGHRARARIVLQTLDVRLPFARQIGLLAQRGNHRISHRHRTCVSSFVFGSQQHERRPSHVRALLRLDPRQTGQAVLDGKAHQGMPRGVEFYFINAMSKPVMCVQHRRILVGLESPADSFFGAGQPAKFFETRPRPAGALPRQSFHQHVIRFEEIVVRERWGLIHHRVSPG